MFLSAASNMMTQFTSKERDAETGLDYFLARYYSGAQGRFTSPDWSSRPESIPYAKLDNPQTLNLYAYVVSNPLRFVDIDGHVERNKNGEVIFHKTDKMVVIFKEVIRKDGSKVTISWKANIGYIKTDNGTKIEASKATSAIQVTVTDKDGKITQSGGAGLLNQPSVNVNGNMANCHGTTFAGGQVWIGNNQVEPLMAGDGYKETTSPKPGDVGVYSQDGSLSTAQHSVTVLTTGPNGVERVGGKGGITDHTIATPANGWSNTNDTLKYFTQHPN
jgi:RHS repeat-associated protein